MHTFHKSVKHDLVRGLPPYKFKKDRVCSVCVRGKQVHVSFQFIKMCLYLKVVRIVCIWTYMDQSILEV